MNVNFILHIKSNPVVEYYAIVCLVSIVRHKDIRSGTCGCFPKRINNKFPHTLLSVDIVVVGSNYVIGCDQSLNCFLKLPAVAGDDDLVEGEACYVSTLILEVTSDGCKSDKDISAERVSEYVGLYCNIRFNRIMIRSKQALAITGSTIKAGLRTIREGCAFCGDEVSCELAT